MTKTTATFRGAGATCPACGTSRATGCDCAARDLAFRQRNAALKDGARSGLPLEAWVPVKPRAACGSGPHTEAQKAERAANIETILAHPAFENFEPSFMDTWTCKRLAEVAGEVASGAFDERLRASGAPSPEDAKRQAREARELAARNAEMTAAISEAAARGAQRREDEELDALALEVFGVAGDAEIFTDANGLRDPYRSPGNKRTARAAARIVAAGRERFAERQAEAEKAREEHRAAARSVGMFGSLGLQLARAKVRDDSGAGIYGTRGLRSSEPLPVGPDGSTPDPYARQIAAKRAAQAKKDEAWANRGRRRR